MTNHQPVDAGSQQRQAPGRQLLVGPDAVIEGLPDAAPSLLATGAARTPRQAGAALAAATGGDLRRAGTSLNQLQRSHGNRHVQRVVAQARKQSGAGSVRRAAPRPVIQAKLRVGPAGDGFEREADEIARRAIGASVPPASAAAADLPSPSPSLSDSLPDSLPDGTIGPGGGALDGSSALALAQARSGGIAVPGRVLEPVERELGADLSAVRLHVSDRADALNDTLQSRAFTLGPDIFVHRADYRPGTPGGDALLAHELTHTVQQGAAGAVNRMIRRDWRGKAKRVRAVGTNVGIGLGKALLGPFYDIIQYKIWKNSKQKFADKADLHPFKDVLKWAGNMGGNTGHADYLAGESGVSRYGPGGQVPLFLRMLSSGIIKKIGSWASSIALWFALIGIAAPVVLPVAASLGGMAAVLTVLKSGIDAVLNTWSGVTAWARYLSLDKTGLKLSQQKVKDYLESYKEYRKTRGEVVENAIKLLTGAAFGAAASAAAGKDVGEAVAKGLNPAQSNPITAGIAAEGSKPDLSKLYAKEAPGGVLKEAFSNFSSWTGKGRLKELSADNRTKVGNQGAEAWKHHPNAQMILSSNLIGKVNEQQLRKDLPAPAPLPDGTPGPEVSFDRVLLPGPPAHSPKGMLGAVANPLGGIVFALMSLAKVIQKIRRHRGPAAPGYVPGPPPAAQHPGPPPPAGPPPALPVANFGPPPPAYPPPALPVAVPVQQPPVQQPPVPAQVQQPPAPVPAPARPVIPRLDLGALARGVPPAPGPATPGSSDRSADAEETAHPNTPNTLTESQRQATSDRLDGFLSSLPQTAQVVEDVAKTFKGVRVELKTLIDLGEAARKEKKQLGRSQTL